MNSNLKPRLTIEEVEVYVWGFVVVAVTLILCFIVVALLYSVTFVTQPIKSMAPIDMAYTKMLNDIVLLIVGGIGGVMSKRAVGAAAEGLAAAGAALQDACGRGGPHHAARRGDRLHRSIGLRQVDLAALFQSDE